MCWQGNFKFSCRDFRVIKKVLKAPYLYFCGLPRFLNDTKGKIINFQFSKPGLLNLTYQFDHNLTLFWPLASHLTPRFNPDSTVYPDYTLFTPRIWPQIRPWMIERVNSSPGLLFELMIGVGKSKLAFFQWITPTLLLNQTKLQMHNGYTNDTLSALKLWIRERILLRRVTI